MKFISLFAGIGGMDIGLQRAGLRCVAQVEIDDYATRVLTKHWPDVPKFRDVRDVGQHNLPHADLICGGFPCQDISIASRGFGIAGERSGLWSEFARIIGELRPRYVFVENVPALLHRGIDRVLGDLAALRYDAEWHVISAAAVGAPHRRDRLFLVAYPNRERWIRRRVFTSSPPRRPEWNAAQGQQKWQDMERWISKTFQAGYWTTSTSRVQRVAHGVPHRVDRLRGLGNAVVPGVAEYIGRLILYHAEVH